MSALDLLILGWAVHNQNYEALCSAGFDAEDLQTSQGKALHSVIRDFRELPGAHGATPNMAYLLSQFPGLELPNPGNIQPETLIHQLREHRITKEARVLLDGTNKLLMDAYNPQAISQITKLRDNLNTLLLLTTNTHDSDAVQGMAGAVNEYEDLKSGALKYMPWPWRELHTWSNGIEPTDYIIIYGRPKNKKTFYLLYFIAQCFFNGYKILVYSKEMPEEQIWRRMLGFLAQLPYDELRLARLTTEDYARMYAADAMVRDRVAVSGGTNNIICVSGQDAPGKSDTVGWLESKIDRHKPDIVFIDGLYLMASQSKSKDAHERIGQISTAVRNMSLARKLPIVATVQANRTKGNKAAMEGDQDLDDVAHADALARDATHLWRIVASREQPIATVLVTGGRETALTGFTTRAVPCNDFSFIGPINPQQAAVTQQQDDLNALADAQPSLDVRKLPAKKGRKKAMSLEDRMRAAAAGDDE